MLKKDSNVRKAGQQPKEADILMVTDTRIPAIIHFIWLGSLFSVRQYSYICENVIDKTTGFRFILWTDNPSIYFTILSMDGLSLGRNLEVRNIYSYYDMRHIQKMACSVALIDNLYGAVLRESLGAYLNFAAASDILRLMILYDEGGLYLDVDVALAIKGKLTSSQIQARNGLATFNKNSSRTGGFTNAIIAAAKHHPWIKLIMENIHSSYSRPDLVWGVKRSDKCIDQDADSLKEFHPFARQAQIRHMMTISKTGPGAVVTALEQHHVLGSVGELGQYFYFPDDSSSWRAIFPQGIYESPI